MATAKDKPIARSVDVHEFPYSDRRHYPAFIYLIWREHEGAVVAKAGISRTTRRWRFFLGRGWNLAGLWQSEEWNALESALLKRLAEVGRPAFLNRAEGEPFLGKTGGHTECYRIDTGTAHQKLLEMAAEVTHG